jgi:O-antigen/teichoic acid export membrane protein
MLLTGNMLGAAVGGVFFLSASWLLSIEDMGRYAVTISAQWIAFGVVGHGLGIATLRVSRDRLAAADREGALGVVAYAVITAATLSLTGAAAAYWILELVSSSRIAPESAALAILWAGCRAMMEATRSGLLAELRFARAAFLSVASGVAGLFSLGTVLLTGEFTIVRLLGAHVLGMLGGAIAGCILMFPMVRSGIRMRGAFELFSYAQWPTLSEVARTLQVNLGAPLLVALAGAAEAGLFGVARYPALLFDVAAVTLYQYWLTRVMHVPDKAQLLEYVRRHVRFALALGAGLLAASVAALPFLPMLGSKFSGIGPLFVLCSFDFALILVVRPIESAYHGMAQPRLELIQRSAALTTLIVMSYWAAARWGAMGMISAHIAASLVALGVGTILMLRAIGTPKTGTQVAA